MIVWGHQIFHPQLPHRTPAVSQRCSQRLVCQLSWFISKLGQSRRDPHTDLAGKVMATWERWLELEYDVISIFDSQSRSTTYQILHVFADGWFTVRAFLCFFWPMGWGGLGWGGLMTFNGTSTHIWCYASDLVSCTHTWCYATDLVSCTCTHTWCYATDLVSCTCTHTWCYATDLVSCTCTPDATLQMGWGGVGWANNVQWHTCVMLRYQSLLLHLHT